MSDLGRDRIDSDFNFNGIELEDLEESASILLDFSLVRVTLKSSSVLKLTSLSGASSEISALILLTAPLERVKQLELAGKILQVRLLKITGYKENAILEAPHQKMLILSNNDTFTSSLFVTVLLESEW